MIDLYFQTWGDDVSSWSTENIEDLGSIVAGLSVGEISSLDLSTNNVMSIIGEYNVYTTAQVL